MTRRAHKLLLLAGVAVVIVVLLTASFWPRLQVGLVSRRLFSRDHAVRTEAATWLVNQGELGRRALETVGFSAEFTAPGTELHAARDAALDALWHFETAQPSPAETLPESRLVRYLAEGLGVRSRVFIDLWSLSNAPLSNEVISALALVTRSDPIYAFHAVQFLAERHARDQRVWPVLRSALDHSDEKTRYWALRGLVMGDAVDVPTVRARLADAYEPVRVYAAFHLAVVLENSEGLATLRSALRSGIDDLLLTYAAGGLHSLDDRASIEALVALYEERQSKKEPRAEVDTVLEEALQSLTRRQASPEEGWSDWWGRNKSHYPPQNPLRPGG